MACAAKRFACDAHNRLHLFRLRKYRAVAAVNYPASIQIAGNCTVGGKQGCRKRKKVGRVILSADCDQSVTALRKRFSVRHGCSIERIAEYLVIGRRLGSLRFQQPDRLACLVATDTRYCRSAGLWISRRSRLRRSDREYVAHQSREQQFHGNAGTRDGSPVQVISCDRD